MKSAVAVTHGIDNLEQSAQELVAQISNKLSLQKNAIGIVYCDADVDVAALGALLHTKMNINVVGLTTTATIERHNGYNDMGILFTVLTADDVEFAVGNTGELAQETFPAVIKDTYAAARAQVSADPALILAFAPYIADLTSENYVELLDEASGGVPVFGGVATDHYDLQYQKTFLNGQALTRGLVFVLLSGNVKPAFAINHRFGVQTQKKGVITKSVGNSVLEVDGQPFKAFVESIVPVPDEELVIFHFQSTPFVVELPDYEKNEEPVVRALVTVNHETGAGSFLSKMPEGSVIYLNEFQRKELSESCKSGLGGVIKQMQAQPDYEYSMMFISTCNARHLIMADDKSLEAQIITAELSAFPQGLNAMGFYGFGEICPTGIKADGSAKNRFHNISLAVCAI